MTDPRRGGPPPSEQARARASGYEAEQASTTTTPTSSPGLYQQMMAKQQMLRPPTDKEIQDAIDLVTGFAAPTVVTKPGVPGKAWKIAVEDLGLGGIKNSREIGLMRRLVDAANETTEKFLGMHEGEPIKKFSQAGPRNIEHRVLALKAAMGYPGELLKQIDDASRALQQLKIHSPEWMNAQRIWSELANAERWGMRLLETVEGKMHYK